MRRLILMRHAKAENHAASGEDIDRALTPRGVADSERMGQVLADADLQPDLALVSSGLRARQTWEAAKAAFEPVTLEVQPSLYLASADQIMILAETLGDQADTVIVVAHNPGLQDLTVRLMQEAGAGHALITRVLNGFPTACAAAFLIDEAGRALYDGLFVPKDHGGGAGAES
jgi:phosphohistidine phosphatase